MKKCVQLFWYKMKIDLTSSRCKGGTSMCNSYHDTHCINDLCIHTKESTECHDLTGRVVKGFTEISRSRHMILEVSKNLVSYKWGFIYLGLILWLRTSFSTTTRSTLVITSVVTGMLSGSFLVNNNMLWPR